MTPAEIEGEFAGLVAQSRELANQISERTARWYHLKGEAATLRSVVKATEADIMANTLFDGKNQQIRDAQFHLACTGNQWWLGTDEALTGTLIDIESCERDIEIHNKSLRTLELQMQFRIEQMQFLNTPRFYKEI